jgi:hypothetical protein
MTVNRSARASALRAAIAAAVVVALSDAAAAAVHKCAAAGGIVYQDRPCRDGESRDAEVTDAPLSVLPFPPPARSIQKREAPPAKPQRAERARRAEAALLGNPAERRHLRVGMSEGEVMARVGPPDLTTGKGRKQSRWTWMPVPGDPDTITVVLFETGRAIEVERTVVKR